MAFLIGLKAIRRLCEQQNSLEWYKAKLSASLFKPSEIPVFEWVDAHVKKHHALPHPETLSKKFPEVLGSDTPEPASYYVELLENSYYHAQITQASFKATEILKTNKDDWQSAAQEMRQALNRIKGQEYRTKILDFGREANNLLMQQYHSVGEVPVSGFGWPYMDDMGGAMAGDVISFIGRPQMGKAQPLDSNVLTSAGWKLMGDIQVGDKLASVDGKPSEVIAIHPQGLRYVYEFTFADGRTCKASDEHLWEVFYRDWGAPRILTTVQLVGMLKKARYQQRLSVQRYEGEHGMPVHSIFSPWLLGVLLGDGCFRGNNLSFTSIDKEIVARADAELTTIGMGLSPSGKYCYGVYDHQQKNRLKSWLLELGLWGKKSEDKFIPYQYMQADKHTRLELLRGLMDTDGYAGVNGESTFSSSSYKLALQVQELVRSLGGKSRIGMRKTTHLDNYIVGVTLHDRESAFFLERKRERVRGPRLAEKNNRLTIKSIEALDMEECQCITVSHPSHLYVTDNYVVTHNSWMSLYVALHNWQKVKHNVLFVSMEMNFIPIAQRAAAMIAGTNLTQLKKGQYSNFGPNNPYDKFVASLAKIEQADHDGAPKLYIVNGNLATDVEEIYILADQLGCKDVVIDGAYLCRNKNARLDRFTRAAENCETMKRCSEDLGIPTFSSWQFNREAAKKQKSKGGAANVVDMEDIGYTDAVPQISSIVLGLFQEDGVETIKRKKVRVMKGRGGETGEFEINWDFDSTNFDQIGADGLTEAEEHEPDFEAEAI